MFIACMSHCVGGSLSHHHVLSNIKLANYF